MTDLIRNLYKVTVEVDVCVLAQNSDEAIKTAKENAHNEIKEYSAAIAKVLTKETDIPKSWLEAIPFVPYGAMIIEKTCKQIIREIMSKESDKPVKKDLDDDMKEVIKIHEEIADKVIKDSKNIKPENKPNPKPKELDWKDTKTGQSLPPLRFL